jgi:hypothetical protein
VRHTERLALAIVVCLAVLVCGTAGATAYAWHASGQVRVAVHDDRPDGVNLNISLPGALVNAAIALCPVPTDLQVDERLTGILPALRGVADRLATMPDAVIVDVDDHGERVRIAKTGRELVIKVITTEERVEIAVPIESVRKLVSKLEARVRA